MFYPEAFQRLKKDETEKLQLQWDLQRTLVKVNYKIGNRRDGDVVQIYSNSTKARKIGWKPTRTVDDMVSSAWKWHKNKI